MTVLLGGATASAATVSAGPDSSITRSASGSAAAGYAPYFRGSWTFLNGSRAQRAAVLRVVQRMHFRHKAFLRRFVAFKFGGRFSAEQGWAAPKSGYVQITLFPGWNSFVVAHEIGHAADFTMLNDSAENAFGRLVGHHAPRGDCLNARIRSRPGQARVHSCRRSEEWASAFARAYCCQEPRVGIEGGRVPRRVFRSFAGRSLRLEDNLVTRQVKVDCFFSSTLSIARVTPRECSRRQGLANPTLGTCTYTNAAGQRVTVRLELGVCRNRIAATGKPGL